MSEYRVIEGDCLEMLKTLDAESVQTCVTSPPYWGLRDYGAPGQLGLEASPQEYAENLVAVFREVRRVLRPDGTAWLNLGDCYNSIGHKKSHSGYGSTGLAGGKAQEHTPLRRENSAPGLKHKDLVGVPWRVAFALQADGWWLRSDIIWAKQNPMPEPVGDRPTKAHEYIFLLAKSQTYFYDAAAIREEDSGRPSGNGFVREHRLTYQNEDGTGRGNEDQWEPGGGRNKRSVWTVTSQAFPGAHFATFPPKLIEPCVLAGSRPGDTVLDPFNGAGTTGIVALRHDRDYIGIEINPEYAAMARNRIYDDGPLLNVEVAA